MLKYEVSEDISWILEISNLISDIVNNQDKLNRGDYSLIDNEEKFIISSGDLNKEFSDIYEFRKNTIEEVYHIFKGDSFWTNIASYTNDGIAFSSFLMNSLPKDITIDYREIDEENFLINMARSLSYIVGKENGENEDFSSLEKGFYKSSSWTKERVNFELEDIFELLEASYLSESCKLDVLRIFTNPKWALDKFYNAYSLCQKAIEKNLILVEERYDEFKAFLKSEKGLSQYEKTFRIKESFDNIDEVLSHREEDTVYIYVGLSGYYTGSINLSLEKDSQFWSYIGILLFDLRKLTKDAKNVRGEIIEKTKALGDYSRFDILEVLEERPYYVKELAEKLGVSSASLSHHLNLLFQAGFITANIEDRKTYYSINKDTFRELGEKLIGISEGALNI